MFFSKCKALSSNPSLTKISISQAQWYMLIIPALERLMQENQEFKASMEYTVSSRPTWAKQRLCLKQQNKTKNPQNKQTEAVLGIKEQ
jgi:hypothetical protein